MLSKEQVESQRLAALPKNKKERDFEKSLLIKSVRSILYKTKLYDWQIDDIRRELKKLTS